MSNHEQSAVEWVNERIILIAVEPAYKVPRCEFVGIADALELAQRCDAAEEDAESWEAASIGLGNDLANMNDEAIRLSTKLADAARRVERLREALKPLVAMNDQMNDTENSDSGNYADAYYTYHKGQHKEWEAARAELTETKEDANNE